MSKTKVEFRRSTELLHVRNTAINYTGIHPLEHIIQTESHAVLHTFQRVKLLQYLFQSIVFIIMDSTNSYQIDLRGSEWVVSVEGLQLGPFSWRTSGCIP